MEWHEKRRDHGSKTKECNKNSFDFENKFISLSYTGKQKQKN
jgi:hypothetical protein